MSKVTADKNYCDIDKLDGVELKDGERLKVTFPDGKTKKVEVVLHERNEPYNDMGHTYTMPVRKAHFTLDYHGWELDFPLEGLEAKRIK